MENDNEFDINSQNDITDEQELETVEEGEDPTIVALKEKNRQLFARAKKAEGFIQKDGKWIRPEKTEHKPETMGKQLEATPKNQVDLDYGQLAFYNSLNSELKIESDDDVTFLRETMKETGRSQKEVLSNKYFQAELRDRREAKVLREATPSSTKRSSSSTIDTVDYWLAKGELPPADQVQLRRDVVNARYKKSINSGKFSDNPIVD